MLSAALLHGSSSSVLDSVLSERSSHAMREALRFCAKARCSAERAFGCLEISAALLHGAGCQAERLSHANMLSQ